MSDIWGSVPQWVTATVAALALLAAFRSISSQREIARKRAAMDFFNKTEMDSHTLAQHKKYNAAVHKLRTRLREEDGLDVFQSEQEYWAIRDYLNLHELMSVGIKLDVFDDYVCYDFWSGELDRAYTDTRALIEYIQKLPGEAMTYCELVKVQDRWHKRRQKRTVRAA